MIVCGARNTRQTIRIRRRRCCSGKASNWLSLPAFILRPTPSITSSVECSCCTFYSYDRLFLTRLCQFVEVSVISILYTRVKEYERADVRVENRRRPIYHIKLGLSRANPSVLPRLTPDAFRRLFKLSRSPPSSLGSQGASRFYVSVLHGVWSGLWFIKLRRLRARAGLSIQSLENEASLPRGAFTAINWHTRPSFSPRWISSGYFITLRFAPGREKVLALSRRRPNVSGFRDRNSPRFLSPLPPSSF